MELFAFGEVLWDSYPQKRTIGGAPFNFSAHLAKLGTTAHLISAVGEDALGEETRKTVQLMKVSDRFLTTVKKPTGICFVDNSNAKKPYYDLQEEMAYDYITLSEKEFTAIQQTKEKALYFGTLAQRSEVSRHTMNFLLEHGHYEFVFFDINIRKNYYNKEILRKGLDACSILKVSREESGVFAELGLFESDQTYDTGVFSYLEILCSTLSNRFHIETVLMTLDKDGAFVYDNRINQFFYSEKPKGNVISTVGAGDSFSACFLHNKMAGAEAQSCLRKAVILSDYVVQHMEAVPDYSDELIETLQE